MSPAGGAYQVKAVLGYQSRVFSRENGRKPMWASALYKVVFSKDGHLWKGQGYMSRSA